MRSGARDARLTRSVTAGRGDVRGEALDATHFLAEDRPEETVGRLLALLDT
jgi:hypothetical protein